VGEGLRGVRDGRRVGHLPDLDALAVLVGRAHGPSSHAVGQVARRPMATQFPLPKRPIRMRSPSAGVVEEAWRRTVVAPFAYTSPAVRAYVPIADMQLAPQYTRDGYQ